MAHHTPLGDNWADNVQADSVQAGNVQADSEQEDIVPEGNGQVGKIPEDTVCVHWGCGLLEEHDECVAAAQNVLLDDSSGVDSWGRLDNDGHK